MTSPDGSAFWTFSVQVYASKAVETACLDLQDQGLNVNLALWIVWNCLSGRDPRPALGQAIARSSQFNTQIVQPLRLARDNLKSPPDFIEADAARALRKSVLSNELEAERLEQLSLETLSADCPKHEAGTELEDFTEDCLQTYVKAVGVKVQTTNFTQHIFSVAKIV